MTQTGAERRRAAQSGAERRSPAPRESLDVRFLEVALNLLLAGIRNLRVFLNTPLRVREHDGV